MYNCLIPFLLKKYSYPFNEDFRKGYKNAWINKLRDYYP